MGSSLARTAARRSAGGGRLRLPIFGGVPGADAAPEIVDTAHWWATDSPTTTSPAIYVDALAGDLIFLFAAWYDAARYSDAAVNTGGLTWEAFGWTTYMRGYRAVAPADGTYGLQANWVNRYGQHSTMGFVVRNVDPTAPFVGSASVGGGLGLTAPSLATTAPGGLAVSVAMARHTPDTIVMSDPAWTLHQKWYNSYIGWGLAYKPTDGGASGPLSTWGGNSMGGGAYTIAIAP